jgi:hypothetical protein
MKPVARVGRRNLRGSSNGYQGIDDMLESKESAVTFGHIYMWIL